jgi:hypothetical protein
MAADPKEEVLLQPAAAQPETVVTEVVLQEVFEPQELLVLMCA